MDRDFKKAIAKVKKNIQDEIRKESSIPSDISDPVASKVSWDTLVYKTSSENMIKLKLDSRGNMLSLVLSRDAYLIYGFFTIVGLGIAVLSLYWLITVGFEEFVVGRVLGVILGSVFFLIGIKSLTGNIKPHNFDKRSGYYWRGWLTPNRYRLKQLNKNITLKDIHAIQLLKASCVVPDNPARGVVNYELNLVLKDATRIRLPKYMMKKKFEDDALELAEFLQVPIWDAT